MYRYRLSNIKTSVTVVTIRSNAIGGAHDRYDSSRRIIRMLVGGFIADDADARTYADNCTSLKGGY
jgi:hypothetical protein